MDKFFVYSKEKKARKKLAKLNAYGKFAWLETRKTFDKKHQEVIEEFIVYTM